MPAGKSDTPRAAATAPDQPPPSTVLPSPETEGQRETVNQAQDNPGLARSNTEVIQVAIMALRDKSEQITDAMLTLTDQTERVAAQAELAQVADELAQEAREALAGTAATLAQEAVTQAKDNHHVTRSTTALERQSEVAQDTREMLAEEAATLAQDDCDLTRSTLALELQAEVARKAGVLAQDALEALARTATTLAEEAMAQARDNRDLIRSTSALELQATLARAAEALAQEAREALARAAEALAQEAVTQAQDNRDLTHSNTALEWLGAVSKRVNAAHTLQELLDVTYEGIHVGLSYDRVGIQVVDQATGTWEERLGAAADGRTFQPAGQIPVLTPQGAMWRQPARTALIAGAEFYYTADTTAVMPPEQRSFSDGLPTEQLTIAIRSGDALIGAIAVDNAVTGRPITAQDAGPLLALAHHVGTALEKTLIHEQGRAELARLQVIALTDQLTDLGNLRAFQADFRREAARAQRHGEWLALALIDVDEFKAVNDGQGHSQGDHVLATLGRVLHTSRAEDLAFRIGGDEFALLLPATTESVAGAVVERLRQKAERLLGGVTLSVGVVGALGGNRLDMDSLREEADMALYEAKRRGRNRVVLFTEISGGSGVIAPAHLADQHE